MASMSYILFICVAAPILLMLLPIEKESRKVISFILIGMFCCLFISEVNGWLYKLCRSGLFYFTSNITPITEEIVKVLPVLFYTIFFSSSRKNVATVAFATGVGFAVLENLIILTQNYHNVDIPFALARGFSSGLMHCICIGFVSFFLSFSGKNTKTFVVGTISSLTLSITYHSVFNLLVQAEYMYLNHIGLFLPFVTYVIVNLLVFFRYKQTGIRFTDQD